MKRIHTARMIPQQCSPAYLTIAFALLVMPMTCLAVDAAQMLSNLNEQIPYLFKFVGGLAYLGGIFFVIRGLYGLREYAESQGKMMQQKGLAGPMSFIFLGAMLIYLPTTKDALLMTVYGNTNISPYVGYAEANSAADELGMVLVHIVQFVGFVSFVRALFLFHKVGNQQGQQRS